MRILQRVILISFPLICVLAVAHGHEHTYSQFKRARQIALVRQAEQLENGPPATTSNPAAQLSLETLDETTAQPIAASIRTTDQATGEAIEFATEIRRTATLDWYSVPGRVTLSVPQSPLKVEALRGIVTNHVVGQIDLTNRREGTLRLRLRRIYDPCAQGYIGGNTHLHLSDLSYAKAIRYLEIVPESDGLDIVFLSHLRRIPEERTYISNQIVENSFGGGELARLSTEGMLFGNGEEHRHN